MKTKTITILSFVALVLFTSIQASCAQERITRRSFPVSSFSNIESNTIGNIIFTQSPTTSVTAEGSAELIDLLQISVKNNTLVIDSKNKVWRNRRGNTRLEIRISSPNIREFENDGVGNVTFNGKIQTPEFKITSNGVGNFKASNVDCSRILIESDGVGNITLGGKTDYLKIDSDGVGNISTEDLDAKTAIVSSDGVGNVRVYSTESIDIEADGIGNVTYYGNPANKHISKDGIGKVRAGK